MNEIIVLPEDLVNKIAAGEVIERPASVVKELIENSLDAGATKIVIEIKNYGREQIKVIDNGKGMSPEDARTSILRYATSKIRTEEDLDQIQTLGFRGEALSSIAAVSKLSLLTKKEGQEGIKLAMEGGVIIKEEFQAAETGTTVNVGDLFFNTPARRKFLKSEAVELRHIIEVVTNYALIRKKIYFKLIHNGNELLSSPAVEDWRDNLAAIYGVNLAKNLLEVNYNDELVKITGFIAKPYHARNDRTQQNIFVNGRWVKNEEIRKAVYEAFHSVLFVNKHPIFILNLDLDFGKVDVNVHPNKALIKIEQNEKIMFRVTRAVKAVLQKNNLVPNLVVETEDKLNWRERPKYNFEQSRQTVLKTKEIQNGTKSDLRIDLSRESAVAEVRAKENNFGNSGSPENYSEQKLDPSKEEEYKIISAKLPPLKLLGQIHRTFFVAETEGGLLIIDQHAAHERVLYEQLMTQFLQKQVQTQSLLQGEVWECSPAERVLFEVQKESLAQLGFKVELFGENVLAIKTVPSVFGRIQPKEMVSELLHSLDERRIEEVKEVIITRMACRAAVMAGEELTILGMSKILLDLGKTELPFTCPHGRPSIIKINAEELEKKFKRKN